MIDRRGKFRKGLHPLYLVRYDLLCQYLPAHWQPVQGRRDISYQQGLFDACRNGTGPCVTNAAGGDSAHNYGCATDWAIFDNEGHPSWPDATDPIWREYDEACEKAGLKTGRSFNDVSHNQLPLSVPYKQIGEVFRKDGMERALAFLQDHVV